MAREHGYIATVKMFIPVNKKDLTDTVAKATALHDAQQRNDLSGLANVGAEVLSVDHRYTSREKAEAAVEHGSAETVKEIAEQAREPEAGTDFEDAAEAAATEAEENEGGPAAETTHGRRRKSA